jgi:hypothetical protein
MSSRVDITLCNRYEIREQVPRGRTPPTLREDLRFIALLKNQGLSRLATKTTLLDTPRYAAPEQLSVDEIGKRLADLDGLLLCALAKDKDERYLDVKEVAWQAFAVT